MASKKRVPRPPTIDDLSVDEFIRRNADPIWLHQNEIWEYIELPDEGERFTGGAPPGGDFP